MAVQYKAVSCIPPLYIGLYFLTPAEFRRYSSLSLCSPNPVWGERNDRANGVCNKSGGEGIRLVNRFAHIGKSRLLAKPVRNGAPGSATDHWS